MDYISLNIGHFFQDEFEQIRESIKGKLTAEAEQKGDKTGTR